jgi:ketosteroid isomerase-like protein
MPDVIDEAATIERLYAALARQDGDAMAAAYAPDAVFEDPAFGELRGPQVGAMWRMLCASGAGVEVELRDVVVDGDRGSADWKATYVFTGTGRKVVNRIHAEYRFRDGLIVDHRDDFSFFAWSRQALGPIAWLVGWNPIGPAMVRRKATARLGTFGG